MRWLRWSAVGVCLGLGWLCIAYGLPLRSLLWDPGWSEGFASALGYDWKAWVTAPDVDGWIDRSGQIVGWLLLCCVPLMLINRTLRVAIALATFVLLIRHFLAWKDHFWQTGFLLELCLQTTAPLLLLLAVRRMNWETPARWLTAITFIGHGLYAIGFHPVPGHFIGMVTAGFGMSELAARELLTVVGVLDFIAALLLVMPWRKSVLAGLAWVLPWALLTSLARVYSYVGLVSTEQLLLQWLPEVILRFPHFFVPLAIWFYRSKERS